MTSQAVLIAFSGLPGTGKTTIARRLARELGATYLRIDAIEQAIKSSGSDPGSAGYLVGYALAEANLGPGRIVVADSVNPLRITREAWRRAADRASARMLDVVVVCSDGAEHRRRVEGRLADADGPMQPSWADVLGRGYEAWDPQPMTIDSAQCGPEEAVALIRDALLGAARPSPV